MDDTVTLEVEAGVARVKLNRPAANNALNHQMRLRLSEIVGHLESRTDVRAVVI